MNDNNIQLLKRYTEKGDQQAFSRLVENHINLAYSAAIAYLGSEDLARDACQLTFLELSRKAEKLEATVKLGGWIHATARNVSRKIQRSEIRRQKREQSYVEAMKSQQLNEPDWSSLAPEIHEALEKLNAAEREAIILRFFQHKSLADVGAVLGVTADAARMRLNRALERLNGQLVRKGIASTSAALATALPSHVLASAPAGLASSISTTVLASAGTAIAGTSTITGVAIAIMKTKTLIISAAVAATALTGTGVYLSTQSADTHPDTATLPSPSEPGQSVDRHALNEDVIALRPTEISEEATLEQERSVSAVTTQEPDSDSLQIDPAHLEKAKQTTDFLAMTFSMANSDNAITVVANQFENPSKKLTPRLSLDAEAASKFDEVLSAHAKAQTERTSRLANGVMDSMKDLMENDREGYINYTALKSMKKAGETLNDDQLAYLKSYNKKLGRNSQLSDTVKNERKESVNWYDDEDVLTSLNEDISPDQQAELATYIEEQKNRKKEKAAYTRSNSLANSLGLNEADRAALYDYLYENPGASNDDISEQLAPELRDLMPTGNSQISIQSSGSANVRATVIEL